MATPAAAATELVAGSWWAGRRCPARLTGPGCAVRWLSGPDRRLPAGYRPGRPRRGGGAHRLRRHGPGRRGRAGELDLRRGRSTALARRPPRRPPAGPPAGAVGLGSSRARRRRVLRRRSTSPPCATTRAPTRGLVGTSALWLVLRAQPEHSAFSHRARRRAGLRSSATMQRFWNVRNASQRAGDRHSCGLKARRHA